MLVPGPVTRSVADLKLCLSVLAGRDIRDLRSVDITPRVPSVEEQTVALVTEISGVAISHTSIASIRRAGALLEAAGWTVEEATPPELVRVGELWQKLIATDLASVLPMMQSALSPALYEHVMRLCRAACAHEISNNRLHEERSRLMRAWSGFLSEYPVVIGPNLIGEPWLIDADLDPETGLALLERATRFILPANALSLPVVALPIAVAGRQPTGIQIYADMWREDLCLAAAEIIEAGTSG